MSLNNTFENAVAASLEILRLGGVILYPTDTVWGLGCDATNTEAVAKIYQLKQREDSKALICLARDREMLTDIFGALPHRVTALLDNTERPLTLILDNPKGISPRLVAEDNTLAVRVPETSDFCLEVLQKFGKPIVSTSANLSGEPTPASFSEISSAILTAVDYVVPLQQEKENSRPSSIIKLLKDGTEVVIRP